MFILKIFGIIILIGFIRAAYIDLKDSYRIVTEREKAEQQLIYTNMEREQIEVEKAAEKRTELYKQLAAVQYQLKLLETLDGFRSADMSDEKEVRKALALEKQYNALWTKERKLKRELEKLSS